MPVNRNALLRYRTINDCLSTGRGYSKEELIDACTSALGEYRGRYGKVGERTIDEDIAVMRSEELGYSAPIVVRNGLYFYSDKEFHLMNVIFTNAPVIKNTIKLLEEINEKSPDPAVEDMIKQLQKVLQRTIPKKYRKDEWEEETIEFGLPKMMEYIPAGPPRKPRIPGIPKPADLTWRDVFAVLFKNG